MGVEIRWKYWRDWRRIAANQWTKFRCWVELRLYFLAVSVSWMDPQCELLGNDLVADCSRLSGNLAVVERTTEQENVGFYTGNKNPVKVLVNTVNGDHTSCIPYLDHGTCSAPILGSVEPRFLSIQLLSSVCVLELISPYLSGVRHVLNEKST